MKSDSNDVKQLVGSVIELVSRVANNSGSDGLEESNAKVWIPVLISGAKEKNSTVKSASEYALITLLQLRKSDAIYRVSCERHSKLTPIELIFVKQMLTLLAEANYLFVNSGLGIGCNYS